MVLLLLCIFSTFPIVLHAYRFSDVDTVDIVIDNVTIVDVVRKTIIDCGSIYISKGKIVGAPLDPVIAREIIDGKGLVAMPGFINTHTHLWQHLCKSCAPNEHLQDWMRIYERIHCLTEEEVYKVVLAASSEAMLSGITSVSDYASLAFNDYALNSSLRAMKDAGLGGAVVWHNPAVFIPDSIKVREIGRLSAVYKANFNLWMGHGPLSFHSLPQVYSGVAIAKKIGMLITEHTMENVQEQRDFHENIKNYLNLYGSKLSDVDRAMLQQIVDMALPSSADAYFQIEQMARRMIDDPALSKGLTDVEQQKLRRMAGVRSVSPFPLLMSWDILKHYLAIHAVWPQREDIEIMRQQSVSISHNPESNMYLSSGIPPIYQYKKQSILLTIGTDGAASNDGINFFSAMKNMWNLNKINLMNASIKELNEWDILQAATINGAKALRIEDKTGSIDVGKDADIILLKKETLGLAPFRTKTLPALLIYSVQPSSIEYVLSDGRIRVRSGRLSNESEAILANQLSSIAAAADRRNREGRTWVEQYSLDLKNIGSYWYKYRSFRMLDHFDLRLQNNGKQKIEVYFISSGQPLGGGSAFVIDTAVRKRFPENVSVGSFKRKMTVRPNQILKIKKDRGESIFRFILSKESEEVTTAPGQCLILAFEAKN